MSEEVTNYDDQTFRSPIAIVGMGCRLPGADGLDQYWDLLENGRSAVRELPESFLDRELYYDSEIGKQGKTYSTVGGLVDSRPLDLNLCPLSESDLQNCDPAHLILCEVAASACRHAGYDPRNFPLPNTGVFIGHSAGSNFGSEIVFASLIPEALDLLNEVPEFAQLDARLRESIIADVASRIQQGRPQRHADGGPHLGPNAAATLIARILKVNGPHLVTDAACASSLVAFAIGATAVQRGEIDMAIVGGASYSKLESLLLFSHARSCSATGSRPFDDNADGLISSEGYVVMLIKTLERAQADGDRIHAVIPGLGISTDGRGRSLWAPRKEGQIESMRRAYGSRLDPSRIDFVEAHATSTQIGDATEMEAIAEFLGPKVRPEGLPIGSVKSNIGHTLETAGIAGLLKAVLAIQHGKVPPTINVEVPNKTVPWDKLPFRIAYQAQPLPPRADGNPRRGAVNAFGIGGLNVHVVVDEFIGQLPSRYAVPEQPAAAHTVTAQQKTGSGSDASLLNEPIAIIGRGNVLPGAFSVADFQALLDSDRTVISTPRHERWRNQIGVQSGRVAPRVTPHNVGGFITDYEFDWLRYRIPPKQINNSNPLQFMLLDAARQTLHEAGYEINTDDGKKIVDPDFDRSRTGVVVGTIFGGEFGHQLLIGLRLPEIMQRLRERFAQEGIAPEIVETIVNKFRGNVIENKPAIIDETGSFTSSTLASRVSKELNLMGGAMAVDAGECSSTAALNVAVNMLRSGICEHMLCAGAQRSMDLGNFETIALQGRLKEVNNDGNPIAGDQAAGFVPGEGVSMLLLTPLSKALQRGSRIFGVIYGVGGGYDEESIHAAIRTSTMRATNGDHSIAGRIQRVVAGAGLPASDNEEEQTLKSGFASASLTDGQRRIIEKVGHLFSARGLTSLLRETLDAGGGQLTALNDLSVHGQNYQVLFDPAGPQGRIITETEKPAAELAPPSPGIYRWAAADPVGLCAQLDAATNHADALFGGQAKLAFDAHDRFRLAIVAESAVSLKQKIELARQQWQQPSARSVLNARGIFVRNDTQQQRRTAFMFPGQGSQYAGMLRGLIEASPAAKATMQAADKILFGLGSLSFNEIVGGGKASVDLDPWMTQISVLLAGIFMFEALREKGLIPDVVCGHSFGEIPALYAAGSLSLQQSILLTRLRTEAIVSAEKSTGSNGSPGNVRRAGGLLSIAAAETVVSLHLDRFHSGHAASNHASAYPACNQLYLTHRNAPGQTVVGGDCELLSAFEQVLASAGIKSESLNVPRAFHTPLMQEASRRFSESIRQIQINVPQIPMISGVNGKYADNPQQIRDNLVGQLVCPVQHIEVIQRLARDGAGIFVETGPQRVLSGLNRQICNSTEVVAIATDHPRWTESPHKALEQLLQIQAIVECESFSSDRAKSVQFTETAEKRSVQVLKSAPSVAPMELFGQGAISPEQAVHSTQTDLSLSMNSKNGSSTMHEILSFDATLARKQRLRDAASVQMIGAGLPTSNGHSNASPLEIAKFDATRPRKQSTLETAIATVPQLGASGATPVTRRFAPATGLGRESNPDAATAKASNGLGSGEPSGSAPGSLSQPRPATELPATTSTTGDAPNGDALQAFLIDFIVQETGYPAEIIDIDWEFEADLGIDSIKKAQMFGELRELFDLDSMADAFMESGKFTLDQFTTLRDVLDLLRQCDNKIQWNGQKNFGFSLPVPTEDAGPGAIAQSPAVETAISEVEVRETTVADVPAANFTSPAPVIDPVIAAAHPPSSALNDKPLDSEVNSRTTENATAVSNQIVTGSGLENFLIDFVVEQTGYPREIIEMDADFEADLGIDSIKKAQLFGELREHFSLDMKHFESMDRTAFGAIRTLRDVMQFLETMPEVRDEMSATVVEAAVPITRPPGPNPSFPAQSDSSDKVRPLHPALENRVHAQADVRSQIDMRTLKKRPVTESIDQEAYQRGLSTGRLHAIQIQKVLLELVSRRRAEIFSGSVADAKKPFSNAQFSEMQGIADGAGVHVGNIVSYNVMALQSKQSISNTADGAGGYLLVASRTKTNAEIDETTDTDRLITNQLVDAADAPNSHVDPDRVTSRYVMRTIPAQIRAGYPNMPELNGAAIILGTNEVARALQQRIFAAGHQAYCIEPTGDHESATRQLQEIWSAGPAPHMFVVTSRDDDARSQDDWSHWKRRRELGVMFPFWFCRDWLQLVHKHSLMDEASMMVAISSGGDLGFQQPIHAIEGGGIAGLLKSILIESWINGYRTTPMKVVDAKADQPPAAVADAVLRELAATSYDTEVTWNNGVRSKVQARIEHLPADELKQPVPRGGHWVCTGGARGITAFVCEELARRYDLKLSLIGTTPRPEIPAHWHSMDDEHLKQLKISVMTTARDAGQNPIKAWEQREKEIEIDKTLLQFSRQGIQVHYYHCDVSDPQSLNSVLDQIRRDTGPIDAILHGAGVGKDSRYETKKPEIVNRCIGAKVDGALALMQATRQDPLKYFVAFGSISGRFGANGHADYSLANEMLAKTIGWYTDQRPEVRSIAFHWHAWGDVGMATKAETRLALEMINMQFMPAHEGLQHLIGELETAHPQREVLITDNRYYRQFFPAETLTPESDIDASLQPRYPMLQRGKIVSRGGRNVAAIPLDPTSDPFLIEHRLDDKPLLPIVIGLEILAEAGARALGDSSNLEMRNIEATNGLRFHTDQIQTVHVTSEPTGRDQLAGDQIRCELVADFFSRSGQLVEADRPYLNGIVCSLDQGEIAFRKQTPIPEGEWHAVQYPAMGSKFYAGITLQRLRKIKIAGRTAWGRIPAPAIVELAGSKQPVTGWLVPSSALDACLFATGLLAWFTIEPGSALPAGIARLTLGRMPDPGESCIVETTFKRREGRYAWFDFSLYGADGSTIVEAEDYRIVWLSE